MAGLEKKLEALLKNARTSLQPSAEPSVAKRGKYGKAEGQRSSKMCSEKPTQKTIWICSECACPHDNPRKLVCRWCGHKRQPPSSCESTGSPAPAVVGASPALVPVLPTAASSATSSVPSGRIAKSWAVALLRKQGVEVSTNPVLQDTASCTRESTASDLSPVSPLPSEEKRLKLVHSIEVARDAGASAAVISALQADLDAIPTPKVGQEEMDLGSLLQLRAKQQAHHHAELNARTQEISAIQLQIRVLTTNVERLQDAAKTLEIEHKANMAKIDQAIAKIRTQAGAMPSGESDLPLPDSTPSKAQVLSEALGNAVNDTAFFTNVSPDHQAAIKSFCALVTTAYAARDQGSSVSSASHFASGVPSPVCATGSTPMPVVSGMEGIEDSMPEDNRRSFVGISG